MLFGVVAVVLSLISLLTGIVNMMGIRKMKNEILSEMEHKDAHVWNRGVYNYLAIGNSITKHPICSYWWNENGMAASTLGNDYVHRINKRLRMNHSDVDTVIFNFAVWETMKSDRAEMLSMLDKYLNPKIDLVTVQLSENVSDVEHFYNDYVEMINYIRGGYIGNMQSCDNWRLQ